ncbi:MAG: hypothetical protein KAW41_02100 [Candidatus Diapherotrites archaeon]|nr:hypothetical protein [Candidatus Diapherotrites archaeon]
MGGTKTEITELWKDWRIKVYIAVLLLSFIPLLFFGLEFGMDFRGGTIIQLRLEEPVDPVTMGTMITVLSERLNGFGLKDISVRPFGTEYITVEVSASDSATVGQLKNLLSQQGSFEAIVDGQVVLYSEDIIGVVTNPQKGYGYISSTQKWQVPFELSKEGSDRFAAQAEGKCTEEDCERIFMFIDRPQNAAIVVPQAFYSDESEMRIDPTNPGSYPILIEEFEKNTLIPILVADELTPELVAGLDNYSKIIVPEGVYSLPADERFVERGNSSTYWLWGATNLKSVLFLTPGVTSGEPVREAIITGGAPDIETALSDMTEIVVVLRSGRLPVSLSIASTSSVSPTLGSTFLSDALLMGLLAWLAVGALVFIRYRKPRVTGLMMMGNASEILIILGITALIHHQLDMASIAGIMAAVGTGVDQFIIITDEITRGERGDYQESVVARIKRAFRIIVASAMTTGAAMIPLMTLGLGLLKGFAITTLIGIIIGVLVVRPAFGKAIEKFM